MSSGETAEISNEDIIIWRRSEFVFEHVCQPCSQVTKVFSKEALGFCVDCAEWLCEKCFRTHNRPNPSRHHTLKNLDEIKNSTPSTEIVDTCTEKCDSHTAKKLKYYCPGHDSLGCSKCIIQNHRTCEIQQIPDVARAADTMNTFQQITAKLDTVADEAKEMVLYLKNEVDLVKECKAETVIAFRKYGNKLNDSLDKTITALEEQCEKMEGEEQCEKMEGEETTKLKVISERCENDEKEILVMKGQMDVFRKSGQRCNMFVSLKRSKGKMETLESNIKRAKSASKVQGYTFRANMDVDTIFNGHEGIGTLVEKHVGREGKHSSNVKAQRLENIKIKTETNT